MSLALTGFDNRVAVVARGTTLRIVPLLRCPG